MNLYRHIFFTGLCATLALGCKNEKADTSKKGQGNKVLTAEGFIVQPQPFKDEYVASGSLVANEEVEIHPEVSGRITGIYFKEGTHVSKGQRLLQLYDADIRAQLQKSKAQRDLQVKIKQRQEELLRIGGISKQDYESTTTQIESIDADIAYAEAQLRKYTILAPFDGTIGIRDISIGAIISPSNVVATLQQTHPLKMDFNVPDQYKDVVHKGKEVLFSVSGSLDTSSGTIAAVDPAANAATRTIRVRAIVPNPDGKLLAGSFAHVMIPVDVSNDAILIPSQALIPTTRDKKVALVKNGKADLVTVITGTRTSDKVQILQGLQQGDTIITTGIMQVKQDMPVKVGKLNS
jgi:membrane fusion protein (multidrug efflux system)